MSNFLSSICDPPKAPHQSDDDDDDDDDMATRPGGPNVGHSCSMHNLPHLEVIRQLCAAGVTRVHGDEDATGGQQTDFTTLK